MVDLPAGWLGQTIREDGTQNPGSILDSRVAEEKGNPAIFLVSFVAKRRLK